MKDKAVLAKVYKICYETSPYYTYFSLENCSKTLNVSDRFWISSLRYFKRAEWTIPRLDKTFQLEKFINIAEKSILNLVTL